MDNYANIQAVSVKIRQDIQDTQSKILRLRSWMQSFSTNLSIAKSLANRGFNETQFLDECMDLVSNTPDYHDTDWSDGLNLISSPCIFAQRHIQNRNRIDILDDGYIETLRITIDNITKEFEFQVYTRNNQTYFEYYVDNILVDVDDHPMEDEKIADYSFTSLISQVNECTITNEFLLDMTNTLKNPSSFVNVVSKWTTYPNASMSLKSAIADAITNIDGSPQSILAWLNYIYDSMSKTTVEDGKLTFSNNNFLVRCGFATIASIVGTTLAAVVGTIALVIGKIVGAIAFVIAKVFSAFISAFNSRVNPLITLRDKYNVYYDFLPIPILQQTVAHDSESWAKISSDESYNQTLITPFASVRVFKNKGNNSDTLFEGFLRTSIEPVNFIIKTYQRSDFMYNICQGLYRGLAGGNRFISRANLGDNAVDNFQLLNMPSERRQAASLVFALALFYMSFGAYSDTVFDPTTEVYTTFWNRIKTNNYTSTDIAKLFEAYINVLYTMATENDNFETLSNYFYGDGSNIPSYAPAWNWNEVINVLIPAVRGDLKTPNQWMGLTNILAPIQDHDFIYANNLIDSSVSWNGYNGCEWCDEIINQSDSPFIIPKYTGSGALANLVSSIVIIAATIAATVATIVTYKKLSTKLQVSKTNKLNELREFNNAVQKDPSYSKQDKLVAYTMYYKAVKSYNRLSWLWGGGTYNAVNGWVDYASSGESASVVASDISSSVSDNIMKIADVTDPSYYDDSLQMRQSIPEIQSDISDIEVSNADILRAIRG